MHSSSFGIGPLYVPPAEPEQLPQCPPGQVPDIDTLQCVPDVGYQPPPAQPGTATTTPTSTPSGKTDLTFLIVVGIVAGGIAYFVGKQG